MPKGMRRGSALYRTIRTDRTYPSVAVESNGNYRLANIERAILESLKYSSKVGPTLAIQSAITAIKEGKTSFRKLVATAKELGFSQVIRKHSDIILAAEESS